jgi:glycine cleavage system H protein
MNIPEDVKYSTDHEWVRVLGSSVRIGITDYAQDALGDVVFVQAPEVGSIVLSGASFSEVESTKSVSDIYAPVSGKVVAVNERLANEPELVNTDPYGEGWICEIEMSQIADLDALMDPAGYKDLIGA